jgi:homoserine kinase
MGTFATGRVAVRVPATSANLGPGFDALGLALSMYDELEAEALTAAEGPLIEVEGEGAGSVPLDSTHLVHRAMVVGFGAMEVDTPVVRLRCRNAVPHGRGLGSSSAAIVGGLALARALVVDGAERMDDEALFRLAAGIEGHPDNVAPAVFGGFTIAYEDEGGYQAVRLDVTSDVRFVAVVPDAPLATEVARGLLPESVPHRDAARNAGRAALVVAGLTGRPDVLLAATEDMLHQPYRASAMPESAALIGRLRASGTAGVVSGAGPSVLAITTPERLDETLTLAPEGWRTHLLAVDSAGVRRL